MLTFGLNFRYNLTNDCNYHSYNVNLYPQKQLNFTYKLRKPKDMNWGALSADGSWNGMIKELLLEEQDMGDF